MALAAALSVGAAAPTATAGTERPTHAATTTPVSAAQQAGAVTAGGRLSVAQQTEILQACAQGKPLPPWLKKLLGKLGTKTILKLRKAAKRGYGVFQKVWITSVPASIRQVVGTGPLLRAVYLFFRGLR